MDCSSQDRMDEILKIADQQGRYTLLITEPIFHYSTDACIGSSTYIRGVFRTYWEAEDFLWTHYKPEDLDYRPQIIGPSCIIHMDM